MTTDYPQSEKLSIIQDRREAIAQFVDWAFEEHDMELALREGDDRLYPISGRLDDLILEFFGVDLAELEKERRAMLADLRGENDE